MHRVAADPNAWSRFIAMWSSDLRHSTSCLPFILIATWSPSSRCRRWWRVGEPQAILVVDRDDEACLPRQVGPVEVIGLRLDDHPSYSIVNPLPYLVIAQARSLVTD